MTYTLTNEPNTIIRDENGVIVHPDRSRQHRLSDLSSILRRWRRAYSLHAAAGGQGDLNWPKRTRQITLDQA